ncbi:N-acetylmuramoyl-L-alanine amidase [Candidatus Dependentiae bacterium]
MAFKLNPNFIFITLFSFNFLFSNKTSQEKQFVVMINPAGHAKNVGRRLVESVERAITFDFAKSLKKALQEQYNVRVILTRYPGEEIVDWESASFSNRLGVDFYLSLHVYREEVLKPKVFLYHLLYNSLIDLAPHNFVPYSFVAVHNAHFANIKTTRLWGEDMKQSLTSDINQKSFDFYGLFGIPFKPLCGIIAPALAIELGICKEDQWRSLIYALVESMGFLRHNSFAGK